MWNRVAQKHYVSSIRHNVRKWIIIVTGIILIGVGLVQVIRDTYVREQMTGLCIELLIIDMIIMLLYILQFFMNGYCIENSEIIFYCKFKRHKKKLYEIKTLVISNAYIFYHGTNPINMWKSGKIVPSPWFTLFFEEIDPLMMCNLEKMLTSIEVEKKIFKRKQKFGFVYQKKNVDMILKEYTGEVYIAKSLYENFKEEINCELGLRVIHIVPDVNNH